MQLLRRSKLLFVTNTVHASSNMNKKVTVDLGVIGAQKVNGIPRGQEVEMRSLWQDQDAVVIFFRRWGCMLCRLWATELREIYPVLQKNNIKLIGVGVADTGSVDFIEGKYFDGDLYYVQDLSTYQKLGFKSFSTVGILSSLFWKQSRDAIFKGKGMGLGGDLSGNWGQTGGALLVKKGGELITHFTQTGPGDHYPNKDILQAFGLENEYNPDTMANQKREDISCPAERNS